MPSALQATRIAASADFIYGKRLVLWTPMAIGVALMAYPHFVAETWLLHAIGGALCLGLFIFRD